MHTIKWFLLAVMTCISLSGCTSDRLRYQPPAGDPGDLAVLRMSERGLGLVTIDGSNSLSAFQFAAPGVRPETYVVTPGKHTVWAEYAGQKPWPLWMIAEPGHEYLLRSEIGGGKYRFWFEDCKDGRTTGGLVGSDDEPAAASQHVKGAGAAPSGGSGPGRIYVIALPGKSNGGGKISDNGQPVGRISMSAFAMEGKYSAWERAPGMAKIKISTSQDYVHLYVRPGETYYIQSQNGSMWALDKASGEQLVKNLKPST